MEISKSSALLVIDIQQSDFDGLNADNFNSPAYKAIMNARRVLDKFRFFNLPVIQIKCVHYTAVDAHQRDYYIRVVTDAVAGPSPGAHKYALSAIRYMQRDALINTSDIESAVLEN